MVNEKFITVLTTTFGYEVAVIRGRLEAEGITCFVQDELTVQVNPLYSNAIGGVKLQVKESDLQQAIEILKETGYIKDKDLVPSDEAPRFNEYSDEQQSTNDGVKVFCPICGSEEVVKTKKAGWLFLVTSFLLLPFCGVFTPFFQKKYYCFDCKHEFKLKRK
jgi:Zn finger protein HypA/HybF involved in hydrogenase expression